jgi:hypothetical protein
MLHDDDDHHHHNHDPVDDNEETEENLWTAFAQMCACMSARVHTQAHTHTHTHTHTAIHKQFLNSEVSRICIPVKILTLVTFTNTRKSPLLPFPPIHSLLNHSHLPSSTLP